MNRRRNTKTLYKRLQAYQKKKIRKSLPHDFPKNEWLAKVKLGKAVPYVTGHIRSSSSIAFRDHYNYHKMMPKRTTWNMEEIFSKIIKSAKKETVSKCGFENTTTAPSNFVMPLRNASQADRRNDERSNQRIVVQIFF